MTSEKLFAIILSGLSPNKDRVLLNMKRNTLQKSIVTDVFDSMTNHPSAGMVYDAVHEKYPSISRATVYRILAEAAEDGSIKRLKLRDASDRYDFTLSEHHHNTCKYCGHVADVECDLNHESVTDRATACEGFSIEECHVEFFGICEKCKAALAQNNPCTPRTDSV